MSYIGINQDNFNEIMLNINEADYKDGKFAFLFFNLSYEMKEKTTRIIDKYPEVTEDKE